MWINDLFCVTDITSDTYTATIFLYGRYRKFGFMSRSELQHIIDANLYEHKAKALNNFGSTLPQPQGSLAEEMIKDPYNLDFISMDGKYGERDLENKLAEVVTFMFRVRINTVRPPFEWRSDGGRILYVCCLIKTSC